MTVSVMIHPCLSTVELKNCEHSVNTLRIRNLRWRIELCAEIRRGLGTAWGRFTLVNVRGIARILPSSACNTACAFLQIDSEYGRGEAQRIE